MVCSQAGPLRLRMRMSMPRAAGRKARRSSAALGWRAAEGGRSMKNRAWLCRAAKCSRRSVTARDGLAQQSSAALASCRRICSADQSVSLMLCGASQSRRCAASCQFTQQ